MPAREEKQGDQSEDFMTMQVELTVALPIVVEAKMGEMGRFWIYSEGENNRISCRIRDGV